MGEQSLLLIFFAQVDDKDLPSTCSKNETIEEVVPNEKCVWSDYWKKLSIKTYIMFISDMKFNLEWFSRGHEHLKN